MARSIISYDSDYYQLTNFADSDSEEYESAHHNSDGEALTDDADKEVEHTTNKRKKLNKKIRCSTPISYNGSRSRSTSVSSVQSRSSSKTFRTRVSKYSDTSTPTDSVPSYYCDTDTENLLVHNGERISPSSSNASSKRKRKRRRGHGWSRPKGFNQSRWRSCTPESGLSRVSKKTTISTAAQASVRAEKIIAQSRSKSQRMKNVFNDILATSNNLSQFTTAYLYKQHNYYDLYSNEDTREDMLPIVKTRYASKIRNEVLLAYSRKVYECSECSVATLEHNSMTKHMIENHRCIPLYSCDQCRTRFVLQTHYEIHKQEYHDVQFTANCLFCSREFTNQELYEAHMDLYLTCPYKCRYCGDFYLEKDMYRRHVKIRHDTRKWRIVKPTSCIIRRVDYGKRKVPNWDTGEFVRVLIQTNQDVNRRVSPAYVNYAS